MHWIWKWVVQICVCITGRMLQDSINKEIGIFSSVMANSLKQAGPKGDSELPFLYVKIF